MSEVNRFKYLRSVVQTNGGFENDVKNSIICRWMKWKEVIGILCDKRILLRIKGRFYNAVVKPVILYESECWEVDNKTEQRMSVM